VVGEVHFCRFSRSICPCPFESRWDFAVAGAVRPSKARRRNPPWMNNILPTKNSFLLMLAFLLLGMPRPVVDATKDHDFDVVQAIV